MTNTERMRSFIIRVLYILIWAALIYCVLKFALPFVMPFVLAFGIAFVLKPLVTRIAKKVRLGDKLVSVLLLTLLYILLAVLLVFLGVRLVVYLGNLFAGLPAFYTSTLEPAFENVSNWFDGFFTRLDPSIASFLDNAGASLTSALGSLVSTVSSGAVGVLTGVVGRVPWLVVGLVFMIIASYFFIVDYRKITGFMFRQMNAQMQQRVRVIKDFVINVLFKFLKAYFILMSITFVEVLVGLLILRVPYAPVIALVTAIVDILPVLGTGTILIPWAAYQLFAGNLWLGIGLLVLYVVITVVRQTLEPRVVGKQIGLYPLLTLICMFIGVRLFGFWGMLGFPVTLTVLVHLNRIGEIKIFKE